MQWVSGSVRSESALERTGEGGQVWWQRQLLLDAAASALLLVGLYIIFSYPGGVLGLSALQLAPMALRGRWPFAAALGVSVACLMQAAVVDYPVPGNIAVLAVIYSAANRAQPRWKAHIVLSLGLIGAVIAALDWTREFAGFVDGYYASIPSVTGALPVMAVLAMGVCVAYALGDVVRRRRQVIERQQDQAAALARDREQRVRLAAQDERASIAREMHDIVAHSLSVVVVQADGAAYGARQALERDPSSRDRTALEQAATTLELLAQTARASLADTRRLVGVLREHSGAEYAPQQGLAHLEDLATRVNGAGVPVHVAVRGELDDLGSEIDLAAFRVVQESLTNVLKHAGAGATAWVDVQCTPGVLLVRITDNGAGSGSVPPGRPEEGAGNGILGMTERVQVLGGTLYAGSRAGDGFEVVASIPLATSGRDAGEAP